MQSKYSGTCKVDKNHTWDAGDEIFYQAEPKCICSNKACFEAQKAKGYGNKLESIPMRNSPHEEFSKNPISKEQKVIDAIQMVELLWCPSLEKSKEVYKCQNAAEPQTNKDVMILAQVFFKAMVESWNK
jgi:hypothetical protein